VSDGFIVANQLTDERAPDEIIALESINQAGFISALTADKVYDQVGEYQATIDRSSHDLKLLIHSRTDAVILASKYLTLTYAPRPRAV
jgi:hypothetical protein